MFNSCMFVAPIIAFVAALVSTVEPMTNKNVFRSYPEVVNYLVKKI